MSSVSSISISVVRHTGSDSVSDSDSVVRHTGSDSDSASDSASDSTYQVIVSS